MQVYEVGGAIRDELLGLPVRERDWVVVGASAAELLELGYVQVGKDFPVFLHPETKEEYALARKERKTAPGHKGFEFDTSAEVSLEQDLARRDLTINAIARDARGELFDPFGGRRDIEHRVLRHVSPAFREDPLRVLRTARFAARFAELGFRIAPETITAMREIVAAGELAALAPERVWQEIDKALATTRPDVFVTALRECGALTAVLPEVERLFGVPQPARWHPEIDTGRHTLLALALAARLSADRATRFAVLTHDLGKGTTPESLWPRHRGHEERSVELIEALAERLPVPRRYEQLARIVARYHGRVHRAFELRPATVFDLVHAADGLRQPERFEQFLLACEADARGRTGLEDRDYPQADLLRKALAAARGADLGPAFARGLEGPELGAAVRELRIAAVRRALAAGASGSAD